MNGFIACNIPKPTNICIYFNNKTNSNLNTQTFKCLIYIKFVAASNNRTVLHITAQCYTQLHSVTHNRTVLHTTAQCYTQPHSVTHNCTVLHTTAQCYTLL